MAGALGLQFAGIYLPFLNDLLKTKPLTALDLLVVFALSTTARCPSLNRAARPDRRTTGGGTNVSSPGRIRG